MARFLARALRFLGGGYDIEGSEVSTATLDLSGVQLVHDVEPLLGYGRGPGNFGGWSRAIILTNHDEAGDTTITETLDPYNPDFVHGATGWPLELGQDFDLWLYNIWGTKCQPGSEIGTFLGATVWLRRPTSLQGFGGPQTEPTTLGNAQFITRYVSGTTTNPHGSAIPSGCQPAVPTSPLANGALGTILQPTLIPRGSLLIVASRADVETLFISMSVEFLIRAVPRGMRPGP